MSISLTHPRDRIQEDWAEMLGGELRWTMSDRRTGWRKVYWIWDSFQEFVEKDIHQHWSSSSSSCCRNITFRLWTDVAIDCLGLWHRNWLIFFHLPAAAVLCDDGARTRVVGQPDVFCGWLLLLLLLAHYCSCDWWMAGRRDGTEHDITVLVRYDWRQIETEMMPIRNQ